MKPTRSRQTIERGTYMADGLYIQMFSIHGLVRYEGMELGRDADTGGQVKYVIELGEALSRHPDIRRVDLFTRLIADKRVSEDYSRPVEEINDGFRIIRVQCGGRKYMRKELLWPHLDEFIDKTVKFIHKEGETPDVVHGHYPDAGYIGQQLADYFKTPFVFTGHSLGRPKKSKLLHEKMTEKEINRIYKMDQRIRVEEEIIQNADLIITSTNQEIEKQYGMYDNKDLGTYRVIPPGVNLDKFYPFYHTLAERKPEEEAIRARATLTEELQRFFSKPDKPLILALCRADKRKNISGLIHAYGSDKELQAMANLAVFAGIRRDISKMEDNEQDVLTQMLLLMDKYDLYGKMAIPKKHDFTYEVPELYRIAAEHKGVFVNIAFTEPFGLTLIEASACGLPLVATDDGGPRDIMANCENGYLVDPNDTEAVQRAIRSVIADIEKWETLSRNGIAGINAHYNWEAHVSKYIDAISPLVDKSRTVEAKRAEERPVGNRLTRLSHLLISDIDHTLTGDDDALSALMEILETEDDRIGFGAITGRTVDEVIEIFEAQGIRVPDVIVASVGAEIYYRFKTFPDRGWATHISKNWNRDRIKSILDPLPFLEYREEMAQNAFKVAYTMTPKKDRLARIHDTLAQHRCHYNLVYSHEKYLDILPHRASKSKAIRYLSYKWEIPLDHIVVCGDSGSDAEMLRGNVLGVVVGNHTEALDALRGKRLIYFAKDDHAAGIIEGLQKYRLID